MRVVVSFKEDVDGLYGTCNKEANAHNKYAKEDYNNFSCDTINMVNNTPWAKDHPSMILYFQLPDTCHTKDLLRKRGIPSELQMQLQIHR